MSSAQDTPFGTLPRFGTGSAFGSVNTTKAPITKAPIAKAPITKAPITKALRGTYKEAPPVDMNKLLKKLRGASPTNVEKTRTTFGAPGIFAAANAKRAAAPTTGAAAYSAISNVVSIANVDKTRTTFGAPGIFAAANAKRAAAPTTGAAAYSAISKVVSIANVDKTRTTFGAPGFFAAANAKREASKREAAKIEAAEIETAEREAAGREAAEREAAKRDAAERENAKIEAAKIEAAKIENAKIEAAKIEAAKIEAAKRDAVERDAAERAAAPTTMAAASSADPNVVSIANVKAPAPTVVTRGPLYSMRLPSGAQYFFRADNDEEAAALLETFERKNTEREAAKRDAAKRASDPTTMAAASSADPNVVSFANVKASKVNGATAIVPTRVSPTRNQNTRVKIDDAEKKRRIKLREAKELEKKQKKLDSWMGELSHNLFQGSQRMSTLGYLLNIDAPLELFQKYKIKKGVEKLTLEWDPEMEALRMRAYEVLKRIAEMEGTEAPVPTPAHLRMRPSRPGWEQHKKDVEMTRKAMKRVIDEELQSSQPPIKKTPKIDQDIITID